jgi:hypothetical protein
VQLKPLVLNLNVKHPVGLEEVNEPGLVTQYEPATPGTVPAGQLK